MKCASRRTSAAEKFSSSADFGISARIWFAYRVASPRYSRCASCFGRSAMDAAIMPNPALFEALATRLDRPREAIEQLHRCVPSEACVGDALAELQRLARLQVL